MDRAKHRWTYAIMLRFLAFLIFNVSTSASLRVLVYVANPTSASTPAPTTGYFQHSVLGWIDGPRVPEATSGT